MIFGNCLPGNRRFLFVRLRGLHVDTVHGPLPGDVLLLSGGLELVLVGEERRRSPVLQAHSSYVCVDPKGGVLSQVGTFLQRRGYKVKVFNSIDFSKSMHYNPLSYIHNEADILKFVNTLIANTKGEGKEGDPFWTKAETLL